MNNNVDDVLFTLLKAKENIKNNSKININDSTYKDVLSGLDNIITTYTINNKMSNKEILDCALSLYERKPNKFLNKINNLKPKKIIENIKNRINDYHKKKETKKQFENEIVILVKEKLKNMIDDDRNAKDKTKDTIKNTTNENIKTKEFYINEDNIYINNDIIDVDNNTPNINQKSIPIYNKDIAELINLQKASNFIFKDGDTYNVYRKSDNKNTDGNINKANIAKFDNLGQAILYSIDDKLSFNDVKVNFDKLKDNYENLASYVSDKRNINSNKSSIKIVNNINKDFKI